MVSWTVDDGGKIYTDGVLLDENNVWYVTTSTAIHEHVSIVAFELRNAHSDKGIIASYDVGWTTADIDYWRCTGDPSKIPSDLSWTMKGMDISV